MIGGCTHIVSLYSEPHQERIDVSRIAVHQHLTLDIVYGEAMVTIPEADYYVAAALDFALRLRQAGQPVRLLVHCEAGMLLAPSMALVVLLGLGMTAIQAMSAIEQAIDDVFYDASLCWAADQMLGYDGVLAYATDLYTKEVMAPSMEALMARFKEMQGGESPCPA